MIETSELLMKNCEKFDLLFVHIQCTTACSLEKVNFSLNCCSLNCCIWGTTLCLRKTTLTLHNITSMHINRF